MFGKILLPQDGSKLGETAFGWARLFQEQEAEFKLLHCFQSRAVDADNDHDKRYVEQSLLKLRQSAEAAGLEKCCYEVREGDIVDQILTEASSGEVDSLVMSSHGRGGLGRWLLGSVCTKVLRACEKPVFVIPAQCRTEKKPSKILLCLDGSITSEVAMKTANRLAKSWAAKLTLFQAVPFKEVPHRVSLDLDIKTAIEAEANKRQSYLKDLASSYQDEAVETSIKVVSSPVVPAILEASEYFDLIVLASHGRGGFRRWILGSVTEQVAQQSQIPVLVIPAKN